MDRSTDEYIADTIATVRADGRRFSAIANARREAAGAADRHACLLVGVLCGVLLVGAVVGCAATVEPALRGNRIVVPVVVGLFGSCGALPLFAFAAALGWTALPAGRVSPARLAVAAAVAGTGQVLIIGAALATVAAGGLLAFTGVPAGAAVGLGAAAAVAGVGALGRTLAGVVDRAAG